MCWIIVDLGCFIVAIRWIVITLNQGWLYYKNAECCWKIVYEEVKGNFLNCDQFWKDRGGKISFHQMQMTLINLITEKGFNLYRGDIGSNKENQTKLDYDIAEKKPN